ncbi:chromosomal replication initiator protein DnaA [Schleiferia thermophila]|jgi:chromosomal replication initiator protein|uniref:Chromosomal replication initiator protein DnaA n=1 Tax=Schleiferia thermophila TaxID=884107 RepID=A0A369A8V7_9FLAO|nr:chromosomal replication initiator protein DnaA [Schleiferia thermophila]KFD40204.1 chromosomal replication initiation protein [Schleiferia thermophila str. Yellowstone]PMB28059.1 chromosomal replication initiation protein DnaA [Fischerella thermalis CCMEE 5319]RCX05759.1 chromosomal replication initiator protein DnaA [Schleiferia thermophila]GCD78754.1 chromosomal replication initiator protein DnaA [Schleiferia thermophila]
MEKNPEKVWEACLNYIKDNISPQNFKTWFLPIRPLKLRDNVLTIQVPSKFFFEWIEEHYLPLIKSAITRELGENAKLVYSIIMENSYGNETPYSINLPSNHRSPATHQKIQLPVEISQTGVKNPFIIPGLRKVNVDSQLNPNYNFDNFIEGDFNRLARSAGFAVAKKPGGTSFNPLLLYGNTGLGKTHLANAIGIEIKENYPDKTVLYVRCDTFTQQFYESTKNNSTNDFIHFYRMLDVLIIDDIHNLSGKIKTQDIFFEIFNHLHQNNKQIILTSDRSPVDLQGIEQRLLSRFKWGLSADLQVPDLESRISILQSKLYKDGIEMPQEVIEYLAYSINTNIRELEGALISLLAQASLNKKQITLELARQMIDKFVRNISREISVDYIQKVVCDYFDLPIELIKSKTRKREVVQARQLSMYFAKMLTKHSLASIGAQCGNKDHATVLHACKTVTNLMDTDKKFKGYVDDLKKKLTMN